MVKDYVNFPELNKSLLMITLNQNLISSPGENKFQLNIGSLS